MATWLVACDASVERPGPTIAERIDASTGPAAPPPAVPELDDLPSGVPYEIISLRGTARDAQRVIVRGKRDGFDINPVAATVSPSDGTFCVDIAADEYGTYVFEVFGQNRDGVLSDGSATLQIKRDSEAPPTPGLVTCGGADPGSCPNPDEMCGNGRDDDCDGKVDELDPECVECRNDEFERNDTASDDILIDPRTYDALVMCPGDLDHYAFMARSGEVIEARIFFAHSDGDLNLELVDLSRNEAVASSMSTSDDESVTYQVMRDAVFVVRVFSLDDTEVVYSLSLQIDG